MPEIFPAVGQIAPDFTLPDQNGNDIQLSGFRGTHPVIIYFYPRADTPGCTLEACNFRDSYAPLKETGAVILGISPDTVGKQMKFAVKYDLPFPLLADSEHKIADLFGVWKEKRFMGKNYMGVERTTFLIDREGVVRRIFEKVSVPGHVQEVLSAIHEISR